MDIKQHATSNYMHRGLLDPGGPGIKFVQPCPMGVTPLDWPWRNE